MEELSNAVRPGVLKEFSVQNAHKFISEKILIQERKQLQVLDLIERLVNSEIPPKDEYSYVIGGKTLVRLKKIS